MASAQSSQDMCRGSALHEGDAVHVFSQSAAAWMDGEVVELVEDNFVRVEYEVGEHWCGKVLHTHSEHLIIPTAIASSSEDSTIEEHDPGAAVHAGAKELKENIGAKLAEEHDPGAAVHAGAKELKENIGAKLAEEHDSSAAVHAGAQELKEKIGAKLAEEHDSSAVVHAGAKELKETNGAKLAKGHDPGAAVHAGAKELKESIGAKLAVLPNFTELVKLWDRFVVTDEGTKDERLVLAEDVWTEDVYTSTATLMKLIKQYELLCASAGTYNVDPRKPGQGEPKKLPIYGRRANIQKDKAVKQEFLRLRDIPLRDIPGAYIKDVTGRAGIACLHNLLEQLNTIKGDLAVYNVNKPTNINIAQLHAIQAVLENQNMCSKLRSLSFQPYVVLIPLRNPSQLLHIAVAVTFDRDDAEKHHKFVKKQLGFTCLMGKATPTG